MMNVPVNFIVSTGRTGSTLLSTMLNSHPEILSISEQPFTLNLIDGYANETVWNEKTIEKFLRDFELFASEKISTQFSSFEYLKKQLKKVNPLNFQIAIRTAFLSFYPTKDKKNIRAFVAKELIFHTQLKKITQTYPDAKFILLLRDPRDNVQIKINRAKRRDENYNVFRYIAAWKVVYSLLDSGLNNYAKEKFFVVKYEELVQQPEIELRKICTFLKIDFHPNMLAYDEFNRQKMEEIKEEIRPELLNHLKRDHQGLLVKTYTDKIGIWKKEMDLKLAEQIWNECRELCKIFEYPACNTIFNNKNKLPFSYRIFLIRYYLYNIIRPKIYFLMPFWLRRNYRVFKKYFNK